MGEGRPTIEALEARAKAALARLFGEAQEKVLLKEGTSARDEEMRRVVYYLVAPPRWGVGVLTPQECAMKIAAVLQDRLGGDIAVGTASPSSRAGQAGVGADETVFVVIERLRLLKHPGAIQFLENSSPEEIQAVAERISIDSARQQLARAQRLRSGLDASGNPIGVRRDTQPKNSRRWATDREPRSGATGSRGR